MKNISLSMTFFYMYIMHNSVCITSPSFFLLRPVVQEKMVKTHREGKNSKSGSISSPAQTARAKELLLSMFA